MPLQQIPNSSDRPYLNLLEKVDFSPIFIMGEHRSGTTVLYQTLVATECFNFLNAYHIIKYDEILSHYIEGNGDRVFQDLEKLFTSLEIKDRIIDTVKVTPNLPEEYGFILNNSGYENYINPQNLFLLTQLCRKIQFVSDPDRPLLLKNPWCFSHFLYIKNAFPTAKFIFIHRHPIAVMNSKLKSVRLFLSKNNSYTRLISKRYCQIMNNPIKLSLFRLLYSSFLNLGLRRVMKQSIQSSTYFLENIHLLKNDYISIKYEDLCQNPETIIQKILDFLQLEAKAEIDYESTIAPRPLQLLPEVQRNYNEIHQKFQSYLVYCGY